MRFIRETIYTSIAMTILGLYMYFFWGTGFFDFFFNYAGFEVSTLGGLLTSEYAAQHILTIKITQVFVNVFPLIVTGILLMRFFLYVIGKEENTNYG